MQLTALSVTLNPDGTASFSGTAAPAPGNEAEAELLGFAAGVTTPPPTGAAVQAAVEAIVSEAVALKVSFSGPVPAAPVEPPNPK